jgi:hypothetical protein
MQSSAKSDAREIQGGWREQIVSRHVRLRKPLLVMIAQKGLQHLAIGWKQSGVGREESIDELMECTQIKNVNLKLDS